MKLFLDGIPIAYPNTSLVAPVITLRRQNETGDRAYSFTGDLTFTGSDFDYIKLKLIDDPNALDNKITLRMENNCCSVPQVYEFYLDYKTIKWCEGECELTISAGEKSLSNDQYTCLQNTLIWDDYAGFKQRQHPRMSYCNELRPNWLGDLMIIIVLALYTAFLTMGPVLVVIAAVIVVINFIIGINNQIISALNTLLPSGSEIDEVDPIDIDGNPSTNAFQEFSNWIDSLLALGVGCGRKHPSPLVRDYAENVCTKCGVTFQSTILNNPSNEYYNLVYVNAPINKGVVEADNTTYWIDENKPILNGLQYFDQLKVPFNAKWRVKNNSVVFERRDFFIPTTPWVDLTNNTVKIVSGPCWNWSSNTRPSYAELYYQKDAINWVGNEAVARWGEIVEWNANPYSSLQKGAYQPLMPFAACRFRDDGIDRDIYTFYETQPTINTLILRYKNSMIMNSHTSYLPMLIIWDGQSRGNAFADKFININYPGLAGVVGANQYYNFPMWFKEGYPGNLYDRFHHIENPRISGYQGLDYEVTIEMNCKLLTDMDLDGTIQTPKGVGEIDSIVLDFDKNQITIKGTL